MEDPNSIETHMKKIDGAMIASRTSVDKCIAYMTEGMEDMAKNNVATEGEILGIQMHNGFSFNDYYTACKILNKLSKTLSFEIENSNSQDDYRRISVTINSF